MSKTIKFGFENGILGILLLLASCPEALYAQLPEQLHWEIRRSEMLGLDFENRQNAFRSWKLQERRKVPDDDLHLNGALIDFHKPISKDDHYLATNCAIRRKYLSEIKSYSKKLEAGDEVTAGSGRFSVTSGMPTLTLLGVLTSRLGALIAAVVLPVL